MKRYTAIAILLSFFLAQFGRVINFCLCTISAYEQTKSVSCDCERQLLPAIKTAEHSNSEHPPQISAQLQTEELFTGPIHTSAFFHPPLTTRKWHQLWTASLLDIDADPLFHPPITVAYRLI